jgi:hypothetical protein
VLAGDPAADLAKSYCYSPRRSESLQSQQAGESTRAMSERDVEVVRECLTTAVRGPFFPHWEFGTLIGLTRDDVQQVLLDWPASASGLCEHREL